jgi:galactokinase
MAGAGALRGKPVADFPETSGDIRLFTAPGRTELGGNHTDHNRGKVLAASVQLDAAAAAVKRNDGLVILRTAGYPDAVVDIGNLSPDPAEGGSTEALIRGIAAEFASRGLSPRGFTAVSDSTVIPGSGLSSSAAVEILIAKIFDQLYAGGELSALEIAKMGQKAENAYFGKPCGLMDQIACASGGAVAIDFQDLTTPRIAKIPVDLTALGYVLCVVDTRGSHADLTEDYAAIPAEMKAVAAFFGKKDLREVSRAAVVDKAPELRKALGDRAIMRALHFFSENSRVDEMREVLEKIDGSLDLPETQRSLGRYLSLVNESGDSSAQLLQNNYSPRNSREQGISLALALTKSFLGRQGACRVHGGGFAGTIQAYLPANYLPGYREEMERVFGPGAVNVLSIRPIGAAELILE